MGEETYGECQELNKYSPLLEQYIFSEAKEELPAKVGWGRCRWMKRRDWHNTVPTGNPLTGFGHAEGLDKKYWCLYWKTRNYVISSQSKFITVAKLRKLLTLEK